MRLIRCRKCGTMILTRETMVETMMEEVKRLNRLAERAAKDNKGKLKMLYTQQNAQVCKMMRQIIHLTGQMDVQRRRLNNQNVVLAHYLLENNLITQEKLNELEAYAWERADLADAKDRKKIAEIYSVFQSDYCHNFAEKMDGKDIDVPTTQMDGGADE